MVLFRRYLGRVVCSLRVIDDDIVGQPVLKLLAVVGRWPLGGEDLAVYFGYLGEVLLHHRTYAVGHAAILAHFINSVLWEMCYNEKGRLLQTAPFARAARNKGFTKSFQAFLVGFLTRFTYS